MHITPFKHKEFAGRHGFSLVELLIVVAIVAIVAALAIPNFMSAMNRARIARTKSDLRVVAGAIEAYRADHKAYPWPDAPDGTPILNPDNLPSGFLTRVPSRLTTPVAYLDPMLADPFPVADGDENPRFLYSTNQYFAAAEGEGAWESYVAGLLPFETSSGLRYSFRISGRGPDRDSETAAPALYDPSNGTISSGDIVYFGPGKSFHR